MRIVNYRVNTRSWCLSRSWKTLWTFTFISHTVAV